MPDFYPVDAAPAEGSTLRDSLTAAVLATPGVLRIEPTLPQSLRRLIGSGELGITHTDGPAGPLTAVSVDLAILTGTPARDIAHQVRRSILECLEQHGVAAGSVRVNVLSIESAPSGVTENLLHA